MLQTNQTNHFNREVFTRLCLLIKQRNENQEDMVTHTACK